MSRVHSIPCTEIPVTKISRAFSVEEAFKIEVRQKGYCHVLMHNSCSENTVHLQITMQCLSSKQDKGFFSSYFFRLVFDNIR